MTQIATNRVTYGVEDRPRNTLTPWQEPWHGRYEARTRRQTCWLMNASVRNAAALFTGDCFFSLFCLSSPRLVGPPHGITPHNLFLLVEPSGWIGLAHQVGE